MAQQADITAFDGAATPVSHILLGAGLNSDSSSTTALWVEAIPGLPQEAQVRFTQVKQKLKSGVTRVTCRVEVPVMESVSGQNSAGYTAAPKVAYVERVEVVGYFAARSTELTRRLAEQLLINILQNVSTTVTPVTTGQPASLVQKLIQVS